MKEQMHFILKHHLFILKLNKSKHIKKFHEQPPNNLLKIKYTSYTY